MLPAFQLHILQAWHASSNAAHLQNPYWQLMARQAVYEASVSAPVGSSELVGEVRRWCVSERGAEAGSVGCSPGVGLESGVGGGLGKWDDALFGFLRYFHPGVCVAIRLIKLFREGMIYRSWTLMIMSGIVTLMEQTNSLISSSLTPTNNNSCAPSSS